MLAGKDWKDFQSCFHSFLVWVMIITIFLFFLFISGVIRILVIDTMHMVVSWWSLGRGVLLASHASLGSSFWVGGT
jgi:hypothetical protein